jgi:CRISPR system Cascade subunit CasC
MAVRSRRSFEEHVFKPLTESGVAAPVADAVTDRLMAAVLGESAKAKKEKSEPKKGKKKEEAAPADREPIQTGQVTVLGRPELDYLAGLGREIAAPAWMRRCSGAWSRATSWPARTPQFTWHTRSP